MKKPQGGFDLLAAQVVRRVSTAIRDVSDQAEGDSEIEKLFYAALKAHAMFSLEEAVDLVFAADPEQAERFRNAERRPHLVVERQFRISKFRVDFLISTWCDGRIWRAPGVYSDIAPGWRKLVVECDGHDFHEKTKEQVARDKARDRAIVAAGYDIFRFSGTEIWRDPIGSAGQVIDWMVQGWV